MFNDPEVKAESAAKRYDATTQQRYIYTFSDEENNVHELHPREMAIGDTAVFVGHGVIFGVDTMGAKVWVGDMYGTRFESTRTHDSMELLKVGNLEYIVVGSVGTFQLT